MSELDQVYQMLVAPRSRVIFDWTPRAGCTAVLCVFLKHVGLLNEVLRRFAWPHDYRDEYYRVYGRVSPSVIRDPAFRKLKFVRNPYTRAVSCYEFLPITCPLSFKEFLVVLRERPHLLSPHERYHSILQSRGSDRLANHVIKIERMDETFQELNRLLGTDFESVSDLPVLQSHRCQRKPWPTFAGDIPRKELPTARGSIRPQYADYYDDESRLLVERVFGRDIEAFGYSFELSLTDYNGLR